MTNLQYRKLKDSMASSLFFLCILVSVLALSALLYQIFSNGISHFNWQFINNFPSRFPAQAGIKAALVGTIYMIGIMLPIALFIGVATAIYLEEYAKDSWFKSLVQMNISNLAGVPSIVFGILGLALFVREAGLGRSILAGSMTMTLLVLPIIIVASQEAFKSIPQGFREAAYGLGATRWQTVYRVLLPAAAPGILTGTILTISRAIGETAPLIMIGALTYVPFLPDGPLDAFTVLPIQIFNWTSRPQAEFQNVAAAGIILLLIILISMNAAAIWLRGRFQKKM